MNDELFDELKKQFPGEHHIKAWKYCFYFDKEENYNGHISMAYLLGLKHLNSGDIGPNSRHRYYVIYERKRYAPFN